MMLRRGTGGFYVNGIVDRWPRGAVSIRDPETYARAANTGTPDLAATDLAVRNVLITETTLAFQTGTGQNSFDMAGNSIVLDAAATATSLLTAFPATIGTTTTAAAFDWTPTAASAAATGGLATFTGKLAAAAGTAVTATAYRGAAAPGGPKWWQGWTIYAQQ
jgi:hypothetical protein